MSWKQNLLPAHDKMDPIKRAIQEINFNLGNVILFEAFINAVLIFLVLYLVLALINLFPMFAFMPAAVYLFVSVYINLSKNKARMIEKKYNFLDEKLRTAIDYKERSNLVVDELKNEVVEDLRKVSISTFMNTKKDSYKVLIAVFLSFLIAGIGLFNIEVIDLKEIGGNLNLKDRFAFSVINGEDEDFNMMGEESVANLGSKEIKVEIKPIGFEVDVRKVQDAPEQSFGETFPEEAYLEASASFEEQVPIEQQEMVKNYFKTLAKS